jgi:hypothetical protein
MTAFCRSSTSRLVIPTWAISWDLSDLGAITEVTPGAGTVNLFARSVDTAADLDALRAGSFTLGTLGFGALSTGASAIGITVNALGDAEDPLTALPRIGDTSEASRPLPTLKNGGERIFRTLFLEPRAVA